MRTSTLPTQSRYVNGYRATYSYIVEYPGSCTGTLATNWYMRVRGEPGGRVRDYDKEFGE